MLVRGVVGPLLAGVSGGGGHEEGEGQELSHGDDSGGWSGTGLTPGHDGAQYMRGQGLIRENIRHIVVKQISFMGASVLSAPMSFISIINF